MSNIYLAKPGGQKQGPYSLDQINRDLATKKISDTDFWAWHEGLPQWMPLHSVPGVSAKAAIIATPEIGSVISQPVVAPSKARSESTNSNGASTTTQVATAQFRNPTAAVTPLPQTEPCLFRRKQEADKPETKTQPTDLTAVAADKAEPVAATAEVFAAPIDSAKSVAPLAKLETLALTGPGHPTPRGEASPTLQSEPSAVAVEPKPTIANPSMSSGKPFAALEQIFVFTTGAGPSAFKSDITTAMLSEAVGEKLDAIRSKVPVDVIGGADAGVLGAIRAGTIPGSAWRALFKIKPGVAQQIQDGAYHLCVRTFPVESKDLVALFLLYNKPSQ